MDVIINPIRMRIIQTLVTNKELSTQQISEYLPDVPQATLYRHLHVLVHAEVIKTVQENKKRGTVERIYALSEDASFTDEDVGKISRDEHFQYFFSFVTTLMSGFGDYLKRGHIDMANDGVTYRQANIYLSDKELQDLMVSISTLIVKQIDNKPIEGRTLRSISNIVIPK